MLAPDHTAGFETTAPGAIDDIRHCLDPKLRLAGDLVEVGEILADTVRKDWPFLERLPGLLSEEYLMAPRPALLVLLAARCGATQPEQGPEQGPEQKPEPEPGQERGLAPGPGPGPRPGLGALAAATDLAGLAAVAQASVDVAPAGRGGRANWGTMFAVLTTDLFLARALELCATQDTALTARLTLAIEEACDGRTRELAAARQDPAPTAGRWLELASASGAAALCAAGCELGAASAGAPAAVVEALGRYGRLIGAAAQLADDVRRLGGGVDRLGRDALADLEEGLPSVPFRLVLEELGARADELAGLRSGPRPREERAADVARLAGRTTALKQTSAWIRELCEQAQETLVHLPEGPARSSLHAIARHVIRNTGACS
ncbi:polyprenyl synthetase family protein [Nonomuraea sp. NBC_01738]|uniref:polyprenyl synthetase family protein n=1 Tax=Nonomuraea sp. NBC_01738 TaxID=2976003 RepID=UPI003FA3B492